MNKKLLWKIQSMWEEHYIPEITKNYSLVNNYLNNCSRYYPRFKLTNKFDFDISDVPIFADSYGEYLGLKDLQLMRKNNKYWYLFDNHNEIIYPFIEINEALGEPLTVVHIDAHRDDAKFKGQKAKTITLSESGDYIKKTKISDFFDALSGTKILKEVISITDSSAFNSFSSPITPYIVSLDIDIFGEEGAFIDLYTKVKVIAEACSGASAICIATSPGFINQKFAQEIIHMFSK